MQEYTYRQIVEIQNVGGVDMEFRPICHEEFIDTYARTLATNDHILSVRIDLTRVKQLKTKKKTTVLSSEIIK